MSKKIDLTIKVPTDWSAVPLKKYLALVRDMEVYSDTPEAVDAAMFHHLCDLDISYINKLNISIYTDIRNKLYELINIVDSPLQRIITINGKKYGFEPNLSEMSYAAYVDLQKYKELKIDKDWGEIMSILYRPVTNQIGELYEIEPYSAKIDKKLFMDVGMDVHFGAMFFFLHTSMDLLNATQNSLKGELQKKVPNLDTTFLRNGGVTQLYINSQKETS